MSLRRDEASAEFRNRAWRASGPRREASANRLSTWLVAAVALTSSWTDISVGEALKLSDVFCLLALMAMPWSSVLGRRRVIPVAWAFTPLATTFLVYALHVVIDNEPPGPGASDFARAFFGLTAVALLCFSLLDRSGKRALFVMRAWVLGTGVNALTVWFVQIGVLPNGWRPTELNTIERAIGLAFHPNSLAFSIVVVLPLACMLMFRASGGLEKVGWASLIAVMVNALFAADSRAGLGIGLVVLACSLLCALSASRFRLATVPIAIIGGLGFVIGLVPFLNSATRLSSGAGVLSDMGREEFNAEGLSKFASNPWIGVGFDEAAGTSMYVNLLSEVGIVGALGYLIFVVCAARVTVQFSGGLPRMLGLLSLLAALAFGVVQPGLTERTTYWGLLLVATMGASLARRASTERALDGRLDS